MMRNNQKTSSTIEEVISNEITLAYAAKNITQYLTVTISKAPKLTFMDIIRGFTIGSSLYALRQAAESLDTARLFLADRKRWKEKRECANEERKRRQELFGWREQEDKDFEEYLKSQGIITQQEKDAYTAVNSAGLGLKELVWHAYKFNDDTGAGYCPVEFVKITNGTVDKVRVASPLFEDFLRLSICMGVYSLRSEYKIPNNDFEYNAHEWLKNSVYSRISEGKNLELLESVLVGKEEDGRINLEVI